jgi:hypothetical protein
MNYTNTPAMDYINAEHAMTLDLDTLISQLATLRDQHGNVKVLVVNDSANATYALDGPPWYAHGYVGLDISD